MSLLQVDFRELFSRISYGLLLKVFAAMIMERQIIFTAERPR